MVSIIPINYLACSWADSHPCKCRAARGDEASDVEELQQRPRMPEPRMPEVPKARAAKRDRAPKQLGTVLEVRLRAHATSL
jgi:hypothetical protein